MIYLDNAATTFPKPGALYEHLSSLYAEMGVNPTRGKYIPAQKLFQTIQKLRRDLASIFNVTDNRLVFTPSATYSLNQVILGLNKKKLKTVYVSPFEHNAVMRPLYHLQAQHGVRISLLPFEKFSWNQEKTEKMFRVAKPDLIVCTHASNVFGNILPISGIFSLGKKYEAITLLDCSQSAGLLNTDLKYLLADFAAFAGHKTLYGPSGIGGLVVNSNIELTPLLLGGTGINSVDENMPDELPERFEAGSLNSLGLIGLGLSVQWLIGIGINNIHEQKSLLTSSLFEQLQQVRDQLQIISDPSIPNVGIVSCACRNYSPNEMGLMLDSYNICVRSGLHCAPNAHRHLKTFPEGTVRFSLGYFNSISELENAIQCLKEI